MKRHLTSNWWETGDYIVGTIDRVDEQGRGVIGQPEEGIRVTDVTQEGEHAEVQIQSIGEDHIICESADIPDEEGVSVWVQQEDDTGFTFSFIEDVRTPGVVVHKNALFSRVDASNWHSDDFTEDDSFDYKPVAIIALLIGGGLLYVVGTSGLNLLSPLSLAIMWVTGIANSPRLLPLFLGGVGFTYFGWQLYKFLIRFIGAILGMVIGGIAGTVLVSFAGIEGIGGILLILFSILVGSSLVGSLFLLFHKLGVLITAFLTAGIPVFQILFTGNFLLEVTLRLRDVPRVIAVGREMNGCVHFYHPRYEWFMTVETNIDPCVSGLFNIFLQLFLEEARIPFFAALLIGSLAAIATWYLYRLIIVTITSFAGAAFLVYVPSTARMATNGINESLPILPFILLFVTGFIFQLSAIHSDSGQEANP